jgi:hypothetical protein
VYSSAGTPAKPSFAKSSFRQGHSVPLVFDRSALVEKPFDCELFHDPNEIEDRAKSCDAFLVCIGGNYGKDRAEYSRRLMAIGLQPISCVHPYSFIGRTVHRGLGLQAMPGATVSEMAEIGDWCILNTCRLGDGVHVMGGAPSPAISNYATIGTNATILPRVRIGEGAFVSAGAVANGTDQLYVRANDGTNWSAWTPFTVTSSSPAIINAGATLELGTASAAPVTFFAGTGTLKLDNSASFAGTVAGMTGNDSIDFADINFAS